jgi:hypothetical protein
LRFNSAPTESTLRSSVRITEVIRRRSMSQRREQAPGVAHQRLMLAHLPSAPNPTGSILGGDSTPRRF